MAVTGTLKIKVITNNTEKNILLLFCINTSRLSKRLCILKFVYNILHKYDKSYHKIYVWQDIAIIEERNTPGTILPRLTGLCKFTSKSYNVTDLYKEKIYMINKLIVVMTWLN
jgi:hypothetical protein